MNEVTGYIKLDYKLTIPLGSSFSGPDYDVRHFIFLCADRDNLILNPEFMVQIHLELYTYNNMKTLKHLNN